MSTRDLIDAIESGNSSAIQQHFQDAIMSRVAERLDTMRIETAKSMFKSSVNENVDHEYLEQVLADNDINSKVMGNVVHVDHDDVEKAQELVKYHGYDHKVIGGLNEAKKLIGTYDNGNHTAKVYHLSGEHNEGDPYHVKLFKDGKHYEPADYFTDDKDDAHSTAKDMVRRGTRNESAELAEGFPYDVDHMPGRRLSMADVNKTTKYTVATNSIGGHKEQRVEVDATSKNHARNLAADHFVKNGLKPRVHFDGVRVVNEETECNKDDKMNETPCGTKKKWGDIKDSMKDSVKK